MPNRETVKKVQNALKTNADYTFFFENLKSSAWIQPLAEEGFFSDPPKGEETPNGGMRFPAWPESQYLARVADQAPELVVKVAAKIPATDNPNVHRDLVTLALKAPAPLALRLVRSVLRWTESPYSGCLHHEHFGQFVVHLGKGGETAAALQVAEKLLEFIPDPEQDKKRATQETEDIFTWTRLEPHPRSPAYVYQELLDTCIPPLTEAAPIATLTLLAKLLHQAISFGTRDLEPAKRQDWSTMWFPDLDSESQRVDYDSKAALAASLVGCAEKALVGGEALYPQIEKILDSYSWRIFERVLMHVATKHSGVAADRIRRLILEFKRFEGTDFNHEYFTLLHDHFALLTESERRQIVQVILEGPDVQAYIQNRKSWREEPTRAEVEEHVRCWKLRRLYPIKQHLTPEELEVYASLIKDGREPTPRSYAHYSGVVETSWGPHSPKTKDELAGDEPRAVLDYLKTWESVKGINAPSPEGLARTFQQAVVERSSNYSKQASDFTGIEPAYVRALISGLAEAVKNKSPVDWQPVLYLCSWVVQQPVEITGRSQENWEWEAGDPNWRGARKAIASLIQNGAYAGAGETPFSFRTEIFRILQPLTEDDEPTPDYENDSGWKNQPATLALNTVRGEAMHALMAHAMWIHRHLPEKERTGFAAMPEISGIFERRLDVSVEKSRAVRSVFGQYFHYLCAIDPEWVKSSIDRVFPKDPPRKEFYDAAWNTYITFNQPRVNVFQILTKQYARAIENLAEPKGTEHDLGNPDEALAEHLIALYWWKVLDFGTVDGLLERFYAIASDELRGHVVEHVGRVLEKEQAPLPAEFTTRLTQFWELRIEEARHRSRDRNYEKELLGFSWWLYSRKLDAAWTLAQTAEVLRLCKTVDHEFLFTKPLAKLAGEFPRQSVHCLLLLIQKLSPIRSFLDRDEVRQILKSALNSGDVTAVKLATDVQDSLLARGNFGFQEI
jgi:hypothetical protein